MKTLFLPNHDENPYQLLLAHALESHGVSVARGSSSGLFPLLSGVFGDEPDVVHFHWLHRFLIGRTRTRSALAMIRFAFELTVLKLLGLSIVWTVHNILQHERDYPRFERRARKLFVRSCDEIVVHSPAARDQVIAAYDLPTEYEDRITVVPHGNYIGNYANDVSKDEARDRLDLDDAGTVYLFFGNIREYKNVPELISSFQSIDDPDARLLIAGSPPDDPTESERLARRVRDDERITADFSYIPDDEIQRYMNAADVVVLPFNRVLTSGSALLAMSFGNPVIAPELGCLPDVLGDEADLLYDPSEPDALRTTMKRARTVDLDSLGERTYQRATAFEWDGIGARTRDVYRSAVRDRKSNRRLSGVEAYKSTPSSSAVVTDGGNPGPNGKQSPQPNGNDE